MNISKVDIIWMVLQGAELLALKGLSSYISNVEFMQIEVSYKPIYENQVLFNELNSFLMLNNFSLVNNLTHFLRMLKN